jgi:hypothetical protein
MHGQDMALCMEGRESRDVVILAWARRPRCGDTFTHDGIMWELVEWIREETGQPICGWVAQAVTQPPPRHDSGSFRQAPTSPGT